MLRRLCTAERKLPVLPSLPIAAEIIASQPRSSAPSVVDASKV
jgi:hypothetical protein